MAGDLLVARESFPCTFEGREVVVRVGDVVEAGHPIVKEHSALFETLESKVSHDLAEAPEKPCKPAAPSKAERLRAAVVTPSCAVLGEARRYGRTPLQVRGGGS